LCPENNIYHIPTVTSPLPLSSNNKNIGQKLREWKCVIKTATKKLAEAIKLLTCSLEILCRDTRCPDSGSSVISLGNGSAMNTQTTVE
jgi:hypothetical protein